MRLISLLSLNYTVLYKLCRVSIVIPSYTDLCRVIPIIRQKCLFLYTICMYNCITEQILVKNNAKNLLNFELVGNMKSSPVIQSLHNRCITLHNWTKHSYIDVLFIKNPQNEVLRRLSI